MTQLLERALAQLGATIDPELAAALEARGEAVPPRYNIAPTQEHWIVRLDGEERVLRSATWGLVNQWEPSRREGTKYINARAESLDERRTYRDAFKVTRCVIPADGFIEWSSDGARRRPFWFHRPDGEVFAFAGLYVESRLPSDAVPVTTFTIVTTTANATVGRIHDRMPVILANDEAIEEWLYPKQSGERLRSLLAPAADDFLVATAVSTRVNSVQHDDPACLEEAEPETQASLL